MEQSHLDYIKSFNVWHKIRNVSIELTKANIEDHKKQIELRSKMLELDEESLIHDLKLSESALIEFNEWCDLNELSDHKISF